LNEFTYGVYKDSMIITFSLTNMTKLMPLKNIFQIYLRNIRVVKNLT